MVRYWLLVGCLGLVVAAADIAHAKPAQVASIRTPECQCIEPTFHAWLVIKGCHAGDCVQCNERRVYLTPGSCEKYVVDLNEPVAIVHLEVNDKSAEQAVRTSFVAHAGMTYELNDASVVVRDSEQEQPGGHGPAPGFQPPIHEHGVHPGHHPMALDVLLSRIQEYRGELKSKQAKLRNAHRRLREIDAEIETRENDRRPIQEEIGRLNEQIKKLKEDHERVQNEVDTARINREAAVANRDATAAALADWDATLSRISDFKNNDASKVRDAVTTLLPLITETRTGHQNALERHRAAIGVWQRELDQKTTRLNKLGNEIQEKDEQLAKAKHDLVDADNGLVVSRQQRQTMYDDVQQTEHDIADVEAKIDALCEVLSELGGPMP